MITTPISPLFDTKNVYALKTLLTIVIRTFRSITIKHWTIFILKHRLIPFQMTSRFYLFLFRLFYKIFLSILSIISFQITAKKLRSFIIFLV